MKRMPCLVLLLCGASAATLSPVAAADAPAPAASIATGEEQTVPNRFGLGYKIGNGLGLAGAEAVFGLTPRLALGLQANYVSVEDAGGDRAKGFGLAPYAIGRLWRPGSTPYLSAGLVHLRMSLGEVKASGTGAFANLGWEWIWGSGIGVNVGAGIAHLASIEATNGFRSIQQDGGTHFNLEAALRYMFF